MMITKTLYIPMLLLFMIPLAFTGCRTPDTSEIEEKIAELKEEVIGEEELEEETTTLDKDTNQEKKEEKTPVMPEAVMMS